jgi:hypothetical protein
MGTDNYLHMQSHALRLRLAEPRGDLDKIWGKYGATETRYI